jgi:hypothetical protein
MQQNLPTLAAMLLPLMMLAGCASPTMGTANGTPTRSSDAACITIDPISPNRGKPGGPTTEDISAALDRDHPVERVRNLVGDTDSTLKQVDKNNAARKALCEVGNAGGH